MKNIRIGIEKVLGNTAFKGSSAFNKKSAKGADLASCVEAGIIQVHHEVFADVLNEPKPEFTRGGFHRGGFRGRGNRGGFRGGNVESHEERKGEDDDGFQTVTVQKK